MKRGFLFTFDAVLALVLVMLLGAALAMQQNALPEKGGISSALRQQAEDRAITEFYLGNSGSDTRGTGDYSECAVVYTLDPDKGPGWSQPVGQNFCEEP